MSLWILGAKAAVVVGGTAMKVFQGTCLAACTGVALHKAYKDIKSHKAKEEEERNHQRDLEEELEYMNHKLSFLQSSPWRVPSRETFFGGDDYSYQSRRSTRRKRKSKEKQSSNLSQFIYHLVNRNGEQ